MSTSTSTSTSTLRLAIVTPEAKVLDEPITSVIAPGEAGSFEVLRDHAPMLAALEPGIVRITRDGKHQFFVVGGGFLEVRANQTVLLVDRAQAADDLRTAQSLARQLELESMPTEAAPKPAATGTATAAQ